MTGHQEEPEMQLMLLAQLEKREKPGRRQWSNIEVEIINPSLVVCIGCRERFWSGFWYHNIGETSRILDREITLRRKQSPAFIANWYNCRT